VGNNWLIAAGREHGYHEPMLMLEWILVLLLAAVFLTNLAERLAVPYPSLLAIAGAGLAFLPFAPQIRRERKWSAMVENRTVRGKDIPDAAFDSGRSSPQRIYEFAP
jgi:hypothetical protein